jgi:UDP-N-acetylmuramate--alanine ligase
MSALALVTREWGAEVSGWDRVRTPYLDALEGVAVQISDEPPEPPRGSEPIVSTAFAGLVDGRPRGELLAELVALRPSVVVAGAHGKTTTAAMIAFCLERLELDPTFLIGGLVPQLGGNARAGEGVLVAEGDESDRSLELLTPRIAVVTNVDLDHHATFASRAEVVELFERWAARAPERVIGCELAPVSFELRVPGEHNRRNAAAALAALGRVGVAEERAAPVLAEFRGVARRLEAKGEAAGIAVVDDYAHHPTEIAATLAALRESRPGARVLVLFQPHLYSRTRHLARELAEALAVADAVAVADVYPAREVAIPGVTGKLVVDELARIRPGAALAWTPDATDGARFLARRARRGDMIATVGAGNVDTAAEQLLAALAGPPP